jgi:hypothetical protein
MRVFLPLLILLVAAIAVSGKCSAADEFADFGAVKAAIHRLIEDHISLSWDDKLLERSGDVVAVAISKSIPDAELVSPDKTREVLVALHIAFSCPRCIKTPASLQPNVTMLLLEHLRNNASAALQLEIDETRDFIAKQSEVAR